MTLTGDPVVLLLIPSTLHRASVPFLDALGFLGKVSILGRPMSSSTRAFQREFSSTVTFRLATVAVAITVSGSGRVRQEIRNAMTRWKSTTLLRELGRRGFGLPP